MHTTTHTARYTDAAPPPGALRSDHAYEHLKRRLLTGDFRLGSRLREAQLAAALDVSRTPIREALLRLHAEGLVERSEDGGFQPVVPDVAVMRWLYEVRAGLELQAIDRPARSGEPHDPERLAALIETWRGLAADPPDPDPSFVVVDESFHVELASAAGNLVLVDHLRQVNERIRAVRMVDFLTADRVVTTIREHLAIATAVHQGDLSGAGRAFLDHLALSQAVVEDRVTRAVARMAGATPVGGAS